MTPFNLVVTPLSPSDNGLYTINLFITDPGPLSVTQSFTVEVLPTPLTQIKTFPILTVDHGNAYMLKLTDYFKGDGLTVSATYSFDGGVFNPLSY